MTIDVHDYFFPILGGTESEFDFKPTSVLGTASCLYKNKYVTAGHTIESTQDFDSSYMAFIEKQTEQIIYIPLQNAEIISDIDLAIFELPDNIESQSFKICKNTLEMLSDVLACGFPHGLDLQNKILRNRAFKGYVSNYGQFFQFPSRPNCYELSFMCPKGISGAPLLQFDKDLLQYIVYGYIIGNSNCEIMVFSESEITLDGSTKTIYEKTESMKFGIAIQVTELINRLNFFPDNLILK
ncbi:MAG: hypothetical protein MUO72_17180 [Bacteroidales bacterium]|nr:hypothetical protein [Bacteroidales bacterium]